MHTYVSVVQVALRSKAAHSNERSWSRSCRGRLASCKFRQPVAAGEHLPDALHGGYPTQSNLIVGTLESRRKRASRSLADLS